MPLEYLQPPAAPLVAPAPYTREEPAPYVIPPNTTPGMVSRDAGGSWANEAYSQKREAISGELAKLKGADPILGFSASQKLSPELQASARAGRVDYFRGMLSKGTLVPEQLGRYVTAGIISEAELKDILRPTPEEQPKPREETRRKGEELSPAQTMMGLGALGAIVSGVGRRK